MRVTFNKDAFLVGIDIRVQQEQDEINLRKMLDFIRATKPSNSQMVLALVDDCSIDFGGDIKVYWVLFPLIIGATYFTFYYKLINLTGFCRQAVCLTTRVHLRAAHEPQHTFFRLSHTRL